MAHHRRGRPRQQRAGCIYCKRWKVNGAKGMFEYQTRQEKRARIDEREQRDGAAERPHARGRRDEI